MSAVLKNANGAENKLNLHQKLMYGLQHRRYYWVHSDILERISSKAGGRVHIVSKETAAATYIARRSA